MPLCPSACVGTEIFGHDVGGVAVRAELQRKTAFFWVVAPDRAGGTRSATRLSLIILSIVFLCQSVGLRRCRGVFVL